MNRGYFLAACLAIGTANGLIRPALLAVENNGWADALTNGLGTSYVIWCAIGLGLFHFRRAGEAPLGGRDKLIGALALVGFVVPSAIASWSVMAVLALAVLMDRRSDDVIGRGAAIMLAVGLREPMAFLALKLFAAPLLNLDAALTAGLLNLLTGIGTHTGNIVEGPDGHRLVILTGCTSYTNLSIALLSWFAVSRTFVLRWRRRHTVTGLAVGVSVLALNILRLVFMAMGSETYRFFHDGAGVQLFDAAVLTVILALTFSSIGNETKRHPDRRLAGLVRLS